MQRMNSQRDKRSSLKWGVARFGVESSAESDPVLETGECSMETGGSRLSDIQRRGGVEP